MTAPDSLQADAAAWADALIHSRRTTLPKRLCGPGPDAQQRTTILAAAAAAPDHGQLLPWRFIEVPASAREHLADAFAQALRERDAQARPQDLDMAREKAHRAPWLLLAVVQTRGGEAVVPPHERLLSAGAAIQNMLLMATAMGLGSSLTSGKALSSMPLRALFNLREDEDAVCFINIGHIREPRRARPRPAIDAYFSRLGPPPNPT